MDLKQVDLRKLTTRQLDALVAEHVMGWTNCTVDGERAYGRPPCFEPHDPDVRIEDYSTDMSAGWKVVQQLGQAGMKVMMAFNKHFFGLNLTQLTPRVICIKALETIRDAA